MPSISAAVTAIEPIHVDALVEPERLALLEQRVAGQQRDRADRDVDEEDPVPVDGLRDQAADEQADRAPAHGHEDVRAHGLGARGRLRELGDDHRDDHGRGDGTAEALDEARGDQRLLVLREPAQQRGQGEERHAAQEHALAADEVAEPAREQQEAAERDQVGVDDPRQVGLGDAEIGLDRRQCDVHDRSVDRVHEHRQADDAERDPAPAVPRARGGCGELGQLATRTAAPAAVGR